MNPPAVRSHYEVRRIFSGQTEQFETLAAAVSRAREHRRAGTVQVSVWHVTKLDWEAVSYLKVRDR